MPTVRLRRGGQSFSVADAEREFDAPLRPRERVALRKAVAAASADAAKQARRDRAQAARLGRAVEGLARIQPRNNTPAELNRVRNARIAYALRNKSQLNQAKQNPRTQARAHEVEAAAFLTPGTEGFANQLLFRTAQDFANTAVYALPGMYETGKAAVLDAADTARGKPTLKRTGKVAKAVGEGFVETAEHPLRHPGYTALNLGALVSGGASAAARASAAAAVREAGVGAMARAALRKPVPELRKVRVGDTEFQGTYSKNPARAMVQRQRDKRAARLAANDMPAALHKKAGRFGARERTIAEDAGRAPELTVAQAGHKLTGGQQMALRAVIEQTPLDARKALAQAELAKAATAADRARLGRELGLIETARRYVRTTPEGRVEVADFKTPRRKSGLPGATADQLRAQVERVVAGGERRERQGVELGLLDEAGLEPRRNQPGRIAAEAAGTEPQPGLAYLGYGNRRARDTVFSPFASRTGAVPKPSTELAGSLKRSTGKAQRTGAYQHNTSRVAATGMAAMNRLHASTRTHRRLWEAGEDVRAAGDGWVPVRDRTLSPAAMNDLRALSERAEDVRLTGRERAVFERALAEIEPRVDMQALDTPAGAHLEGVRWVPRAVFDRVTQTGQRSAVATHWSARLVQQTWREFNSAIRAMVLYSKGAGVGYVTPNLAANVLLLGFQGGPKAMRAAVRSLNPKFREAVGTDAWNAGKARMGEGFMASTFAEDAGRSGAVSAATRRWANMLGKVTDEQTRMAALVYEAAERGHKTAAQFRRLMTDPKLADEAMDVTIRARDAALDYGLMSPPERSLIASWLFVYPFIRASTRYAINFPADHPYQAAVYAQLAEIAKGNPELGDRGTSYDAGLVKVGERDGLPLAANVNSMSPFTAAPELAETAAGVLRPSGPDRGRGLLDIANPAVQAAIETLAGKDSFTGEPVKQNLAGFAGQIEGSLPPVQAARQWRKTPEELERQVSPRTHADVLAQQAAGSLAPKPYNVGKAQEYRDRDKLAAMPPAKRARRKAFQERELVFETMRRNNPEMLENGRLPAPVRQAYNRKAQVEAVRAQARHDSHGSTVDYYRRAAVAEARLYEGWGVAPKGFAADVQRLAATASLAKLRQGVEKMRDAIAPNAYRDITAAGSRYLDRHTS